MCMCDSMFISYIYIQYIYIYTYIYMYTWVIFLLWRQPAHYAVASAVTTWKEKAAQAQAIQIQGRSDDVSFASAFQALGFVLHGVQTKSSTFTGTPMAVAGVKPRKTWCAMIVAWFVMTSHIERNMCKKMHVSTKLSDGVVRKETGNKHQMVIPSRSHTRTWRVPGSFKHENIYENHDGVMLIMVVMLMMSL